VPGDKPIDPEKPREILIITNGEVRKIVVPNFSASRVPGYYMNIVKTFLRTNNAMLLEPFKSRAATDVDGKIHPYETRPNVLYRLRHAGDLTFEEVYRILD